MRRLTLIALVLIACFIGCEKQFEGDENQVIAKKVTLMRDSSTPHQSVSESLECSRTEFQSKYNELRREMMRLSAPSPDTSNQKIEFTVDVLPRTN